MAKSTFDVLESIEKHIEALKPLLPKQALVCIGEYPIKTILKEPSISKEVALPIFIEKSSDEIYKWLPKGYDAAFCFRLRRRTHRYPLLVQRPADNLQRISR